MEALGLTRARARLPLRIGVTGTRGKSSVVRLVAAALRGSGRVTVAKTTGSRPVLLHADGGEEILRRRGSPSILEQKKLLALAVREGAEAFVAEIMSVRGENQAMESNRILGINVCGITNSRVDHAAEQGGSRTEVARVLSASVPPGGVVVCPEGEDLPELREAALRKGTRLVTTRRVLEEDLRSVLPRLGYLEFEENLCLALGICRAAGLEEKSALRAMGAALPDLGALRAWRWEEDGRTLVFVNAFAANDIVSSRAVLEKILDRMDPGLGVAGILNLRDDRPERTGQWIEALGTVLHPRLSGIYIVGPQAEAARRGLRKAPVPCLRLKERDPEGILRAVGRGHPGGLCVVGLGNMAVLGERLVGYCEERGVSYEP